MKKQKALRQEIFYLYWNNHLQPVERSKEAVKKYVNNQMAFFGKASLKEYRLSSNYSDIIDLEKFLNED